MTISLSIDEMEDEDGCEDISTQDSTILRDQICD